ncbi:MAG: hypothetical protein FP826_14555 [Sphingomonadales bacterium]|nr:hypothetical protein [Sphingomonadales bacterium]MBU3993404.1 hypothetical protein [Alphaproteobacteria bacterium]
MTDVAQATKPAIKARPEVGLTEAILLERLAAMVPDLRARAIETEQLRKLPEQTMIDARASGFLSAFRTRHFGGPGLGLSALANGARVLAHGCASSAWTLVFLAQHTWMFAKAPLALQEDLLGGEFPGMMAGALAKLGTAEKVDGGYLISARSEWNSAIMHSEWVNMKVDVDGVVHLAVLPVKDVTVEDVWFTSGLRGTGSNTVVAERVFAPTHRVAPNEAMMGTQAHPVHDDEPFASYPFLPVVLMTISGISLGSAEAAVDAFRDTISKRVVAFTGGARQVDRPESHLRLGEIMGTLRLAQTIWRDSIAQIVDAYEDRSGMEIEQRVAIRQNASRVTRMAAEILQQITASSGGSSYFDASPLQRMQRDVEVIKSHATLDWDRAAQMMGKVALGLPLDKTDMY